MILLAVVAASPGTTSLGRTYIRANIPKTITMRYRKPAILAVRFVEFIIHLSVSLVLAD
jgi:hypothetical protein